MHGWGEIAGKVGVDEAGRDHVGVANDAFGDAGRGAEVVAVNEVVRGDVAFGVGLVAGWRGWRVVVVGRVGCG